MNGIVSAQPEQLPISARRSTPGATWGNRTAPSRTISTVTPGTRGSLPSPSERTGLAWQQFELALSALTDSVALTRISNHLNRNAGLLHAALSSVDSQALACAFVAVDRHYQGDHTGCEQWLDRAREHGLHIHLIIEQIDDWPEGAHGLMCQEPDGSWYAFVDTHLDPELAAHITTTMIASAVSAPSCRREAAS